MKRPGTPLQKGETGSNSDESTGGPAQVVELKLYIARLTPNSVRAEQNLQAAMKTIHMEGVIFNIEVIDVFTDGKRAILDNVIVTPTLIVAKGSKRYTIVGDLSETIQWHAMLTS